MRFLCWLLVILSGIALHLTAQPVFRCSLLSAKLGATGCAVGVFASNGINEVVRVLYQDSTEFPTTIPANDLKAPFLKLQGEDKYVFLVSFLGGDYYVFPMFSFTQQIDGFFAFKKGQYEPHEEALRSVATSLQQAFAPAMLAHASHQGVVRSCLSKAFGIGECLQVASVAADCKPPQEALKTLSGRALALYDRLSVSDPWLVVVVVVLMVVLAVVLAVWLWRGLLSMLKDPQSFLRSVLMVVLQSKLKASPSGANGTPQGLLQTMRQIPLAQQEQLFQLIGRTLKEAHGNGQGIIADTSTHADHGRGLETRSLPLHGG